MTTNILTILVIVALVVSVCYLIISLYSWMGAMKSNKATENAIHEIESRTNDLEQFYKEIEPLLEELGQKRKIGFQEYDLLPESSRISYFKAHLKAGIEAGIEYKNLCTALAKDKQLELRKFCVGQYLNPNTSSSDRIKHADLLYQYLTTGKQPENKEEQP